MGGRNLSQKPAIVTGNPGSYDGHPFALFDKTGFGKDFPFTLVIEKVGIYVNRQGKTLTLFAEFSGPDGQNGGGNVCHPEHGAGLHSAKWVACSWNHRHPADDAIVIAFFNKKFQFPGPSRRLKMLLDIHNAMYLLMRLTDGDLQNLII